MVESSAPKSSSLINPGEITILIPTRARPHYLKQALASLERNTAVKEKVFVRIYVDEDDTVTREAIDKGELSADLPIHWHIAPQTGGLGQTHHTLWKTSSKTSEIYMVSGDDVLFETKDWDEVVRQELAKYPDGILLAFPHDPMTSDTSTYPAFGWRWLETLGQVFTGYFPYWFDDRWVHEVAEMASRSAKIPVLLHPVKGKGKTRHMRNMPFWVRFYQLTLTERMEWSLKLVTALHPRAGPEREKAMDRLQNMAESLRKEQDRFSPEYEVFREERFSQESPEQRSVFDARHLKQEAQAVSWLLQHALEFQTTGRHEEALKFINATFLSDLRIRQAIEMKAASLHAMGHEQEVRRLESASICAWPRMNLIRKLFRFLGMVASEGKTMMVGFTEKGRRGKGAA